MLAEIFGIPTYFLYLSLLFTLFIFIIPYFANSAKLNVQILMNTMGVILVVGFIGARLTHVFYENFDFYKDQPLDIFKVWQGGYVFFGGAIPAIFFGYLYLKYKKENLGEWLDFWAPFGALGYGLGRVSCFLTGCCYGKYCNLPWAIDSRHPTQLYALFYELIIFLIILNLKFIIRAGNKFYNSGIIFWFWIFCHGLGRIIMENFRDDFRGDFIYGFSISSWLGLGISILGLIQGVRVFTQG